jgi:hypothetical protein
MYEMQPAAFSCKTSSDEPTIPSNNYVQLKSVTKMSRFKFFTRLTRTTPFSCITMQLAGFFESWCRALAVDVCTSAFDDFKYLTNGATAPCFPNNSLFFPHLQHCAIASVKCCRSISSFFQIKDKKKVIYSRFYSKFD